jgi:spore maturation protein A
MSSPVVSKCCHISSSKGWGTSMLNVIWLAMLCLSVIVGFIQGRINEVVLAVTASAKLGFELALGLAGIMALWLGILAIARESGLITLLARALRPLLIRIFPDVPINHPAMGSILMNIAANMLGMGNAATPFGIKAMQELQELNKDKDIASDSMCIFLAINTSSVQLIPATAIAFLAANGCTEPGSVIFTTLVATTASTTVAIIAVKRLAKISMFKLKTADNI